MWWAETDSGIGGVGMLVKEQCDRVMKVSRRNDRIRLNLEKLEKVIVKLMCASRLLSGKPFTEKQRLYDDLACEWNRCSSAEMVFGLGDFNSHGGKLIDSFERIHGTYGYGARNVEEKKILKFRDEKDLCVANLWFKM